MKRLIPLTVVAVAALVSALLAEAPRYIVVAQPDGSTRVFSGSPKPGESPYSPELLAVLDAAWRPTTLPATLPATVPSDTGSRPPLVVDPPEVNTPPPPDPQYVRIADKPRTERRGNGYAITKAGTYDGVLVRGFEQNITISGPGPFVLTNVRSTDAWRGLPQHVNNGQGLYIAEGAGDVTIKGGYFARNGWRIGDKPNEKNDRRHGIYANTGGKLVLEDCILDSNCTQGLKTMRDTVLRRCFIHANAISVSAVYGTLTIEDSVIYVGGYYVDGSGNVTGNTALQLYTLARLNNVLIVGGPAYDPAPDRKGPFDMGVTKCDATHGQYRNLLGGKIEATNCTIAGWAGKTFAGDRPHNGTGFRVLPAAVAVDVRPILAAVDEGRLSAADGARQASELVRAAVK